MHSGHKKTWHVAEFSVFVVTGAGLAFATLWLSQSWRHCRCSASLRLRVNLLFTQNQILRVIAKLKKPAPLGPAIFIFGSGGASVELYAD